MTDTTDSENGTTDTGDKAASSDEKRTETQGETEPESGRRETPGKGHKPTARAIEPSAPEEFGLVQVWWGPGKGKTTAAMGMGFRAAGHGYRVHMLQFMKGGADSVEDVRDEYNAIEVCPGFSYENLGHYGWHDLPDGSDDEKHEQNAQAGFERARELVEAARGVTGPLALDGAAAEGCHMLILDEILYAVNRGFLDSRALVEFVADKPAGLELILTGGHEEPSYIYDHADLVSQVDKEKHPIDAGQRARKGTEY
jgi:cob(I)alamin adenosyltransferase